VISANSDAGSWDMVHSLDSIDVVEPARLRRAGTSDVVPISGVRGPQTVGMSSGDGG